MHKDIKEKEMTGTQQYFLAHQTCQWWKAVFIQAKRFFALFNDNSSDPWCNDENCIFIPERLFLITAIFHAIENIEKLDFELQRKNDESLEKVMEAIKEVASLEDIKNLRDMNEHHMDYLMNSGQHQDQFYRSVVKDGYKINTTAAWTIVHGDANIILIGNVPIDQLLKTMKEQLPFVLEKTKEIYEKGLRSAVAAGE